MNLCEHGVVALVISNRRFLLFEDSRELMKGYWGPPHGRCEETDGNEENGVRRETLEEVGLKVEPIKKLWTTEADTKTKTVSFWQVKLVDDIKNIKVDNSESSQHGWFTLEEALRLKLYPGTKTFLEKVETGEIELAY